MVEILSVSLWDGSTPLCCLGAALGLSRGTRGAGTDLGGWERPGGLGETRGSLISAGITRTNSVLAPKASGAEPAPGGLGLQDLGQGQPQPLGILRSLSLLPVQSLLSQALFCRVTFCSSLQEQLHLPGLFLGERRNEDVGLENV